MVSTLPELLEKLSEKTGKAHADPPFLGTNPRAAHTSFQEGARVQVHWLADDQWYLATLTGLREASTWLVTFDDPEFGIHKMSEEFLWPLHTRE